MRKIIYLEENLKKIPVNYNCDVAVIGGGIAGISAALSAARMGKKVILTEKEYTLGGLATSGLITIYLSICDGLGNQVSFGLAEELLRLSISMGAEKCPPDNWLELDKNFRKGVRGQRFYSHYNAWLFAILAEQLLIENGVEILYGTYAVNVRKESDKIRNIIIENKSGRQAIAVKSVVDATGDCDIALFSGAPTDTFKQGNVLAAWYYSCGEDGFTLNPLGAADIPDSQKDENYKEEHLISRRFSGLDGKELSEQIILSHKQILKDILKRRKTDKSIVPTTIPSIPQIRMTRKIVGEYVLDDKEEHKFFEDSIGMVSDWRKAGPVYEVPFRTLYSKTVKNLICAGRCTSVTDAMWDIMRVIPCCAVTGQAAGVAAAMTDDFDSINISDLQENLKKQNVIIHECDL